MDGLTTEELQTIFDGLMYLRNRSGEEDAVIDKIEEEIARRGSKGGSLGEPSE